MKEQKTKNKMANLNPNIAMSTLSINDLNTPIKTQKLAEWIKNMTQPYGGYKKLTSTINNLESKNSLEVKEWKQIYDANINQTEE